MGTSTAQHSTTYSVESSAMSGRARCGVPRGSSTATPPPSRDTRLKLAQNS
ncbi:hypothetical protein JYU34_000222 [Plutella xylostella]|uniref:Uncharacterized protein n=1 Tax=Plutella xylostella TaxID=51655 RepID=A0ABQ7R764_PLUXY|nr:hypothetical protein JYU34_000222 [Plutella xylostella]